MSASGTLRGTRITSTRSWGSSRRPSGHSTLRRRILVSRPMLRSLRGFDRSVGCTATPRTGRGLSRNTRRHNFAGVSGSVFSGVTPMSTGWELMSSAWPYRGNRCGTNGSGAISVEVPALCWRAIVKPSVKEVDFCSATIAVQGARAPIMRLLTNYSAGNRPRKMLRYDVRKRGSELVDVSRH